MSRFRPFRSTTPVPWFRRRTKKYARTAMRRATTSMSPLKLKGRSGDLFRVAPPRVQSGGLHSWRLPRHLKTGGKQRKLFPPKLVELGLARRQRFAEGLAHARAMQAGVVALLRTAGYNLQIREYRSRLGQKSADLLLEYRQIGKFAHRAVARRTCKTRKVHPVPARDRVTAIRLVGAVLTHKVVEVGRRLRCDRHQAAEIHEQTAVTVEHDDALVRPPQCKAERMRGRKPHCAVGQVIERMRPDIDPGERSRIDW